MRQLSSTALVACIVGALAGASISALAQAPTEPPMGPTALNADTVDRLSAVKATSNKKARRNKLVATDAKGWLPSNIVKPLWRLVSGKPAFLADDLIGWDEVAGIPAGFADGVDAEGVTKVAITRVVSAAPAVLEPHLTGKASVTCPAGSAVIGGGFATFGDVRVWGSRPIGTDGWSVYGYNLSTESRELSAIAMCLAVEPSAAIIVAKKKRG